MLSGRLDQPVHTILREYPFAETPLLNIILPREIRAAARTALSQMHIYDFAGSIAAPKKNPAAHAGLQD